MIRQSCLKAINLENYRNFAALTINNLPAAPILILGENGSGKTNILESISYLAPGRGLRSASLEEVCRHGQSLWSAAMVIESKMGPAEIQSEFSANQRRQISYNGKKITGSELPKFIDVIWLTPQMEGIFLGAGSNRRRFLDRMIYHFDVSYAQLVSKYEYYLRERLKVLTGTPYGNHEQQWLDILEEKIAASGVMIAAKRHNAIGLLTTALNKIDIDLPKADFSLASDVMEGNKELYIERLAQNRKLDQKLKRTNFGVHRDDFIVTHRSKNILAKFCSTGEQKLLLIALLIAHINGVMEHNKITPVLLLDELFVHLDETRKQQLTEYILAHNMQCWITATDARGIERLAKNSHIINL